jgi:hypothetical protein
MVGVGRFISLPTAKTEGPAHAAAKNLVIVDDQGCLLFFSLHL